MASIG